jgi:hypothetical protein
MRWICTVSAALSGSAALCVYMATVFLDRLERFKAFPKRPLTAIVCYGDSGTQTWSAGQEKPVHLQRKLALSGAR